MSHVRRVVAVVDELMGRSRIEAAAQEDVILVFPRDVEDFSAQLDPPPDLIVVALASNHLPWIQLIQEARANPASRTVPIVGFGPHMDLELRHGALEAGADRVLANSAFMVALPRLLRGDEDDGGEKAEGS